MKIKPLATFKIFEVILFLGFIASLGFASPECFALPFNTDMLEVQPGPDKVSRKKPAGSIAIGSLQRQKPELTSEWVQKNPFEGDVAAVERGHEKFRANCSPCHGTFESGKHVPSPLMLKGMPSIDVSSEAVRFSDPGKNQSPKPDAHLFTYIYNGGALMPAYGYKLSNDDIWDLISYVRQVQREASNPSEKK